MGPVWTLQVFSRADAPYIYIQGGSHVGAPGLRFGVLGARNAQSFFIFGTKVTPRSKGYDHTPCLPCSMRCLWHHSGAIFGRQLAKVAPKVRHLRTRNVKNVSTSKAFKPTVECLAISQHSRPQDAQGDAYRRSNDTKRRPNGPKRTPKCASCAPGASKKVTKSKVLKPTVQGLANSQHSRPQDAQSDVY